MAPSSLALLALASLLMPAAARPATLGMKRDQIGDEETVAFVHERKDPNFSCHWRDSSTKGARTFWCPSPCRLDERADREAGADLQPRHWQCPPTLKGGPEPSDTLCKWKRSGRLVCPPNCGWSKDSEGMTEWRCETSETIRYQTQDERQQFHLGWSSGPIDRQELEVRSSYLCPKKELACPFAPSTNIGATLVPSGSFECVDPRESLENCGGCTFIPGSGGVDCTSLKGSHASCVGGRCEVLHCHAGYSLVEGVCMKTTPHSSSL